MLRPFSFLDKLVDVVIAMKSLWRTLGYEDRVPMLS